MASYNRKPVTKRTHEGGVACHISPELQLRRSVMACMLWEDKFYEDGKTIADRIMDLVPLVSPEKVSQIAVDARQQMKLRHVPLLLCVALARQGNLRKETLATVIERADELAEFLALYWMDGKCPLSAQVKKGLAKAFTKFNAYQLAKYNRGNTVKLRDVMFMCHAKPKDAEQAEVFRKLAGGTLESPDTWEVNLSAGADKKETFERLISEKKLGGLALLRNLRNMVDANVPNGLIKEALSTMNTQRILPFRFIAAAKYAPSLESHIEKAFFRNMEFSQLSGRTVVLVDVSGSMEWEKVSAKSDMMSIDAACGLAMCVREMCDDVAVYTFSMGVVQVPDRRGFALRDAVVNSQYHGGTYLRDALQKINAKENYDRIIVITDEQSADGIVVPKGKGYVINVSTNRNGVGYGAWTHIDGFSEAVLNYIKEIETL